MLAGRHELQAGGRDGERDGRACLPADDDGADGLRAQAPGEHDPQAAEHARERHGGARVDADDNGAVHQLAPLPPPL
eukprot:381881-Pyramimonas_sp.AAC.1